MNLLMKYANKTFFGSHCKKINEIMLFNERNMLVEVDVSAGPLTVEANIVPSPGEFYFLKKFRVKPK